VVDLTPWSDAGQEGDRIGEIWYERASKGPPDPSLLLKLLFTGEPLSIQVHPDDACAQSMGLPSGKTEAWYVLNAAPGAKVGLGLNRRLTNKDQLRSAANDGSIVDLVAWQAVWPNDAIFVPAGTIHAIGAGLVIAEIQQRSDVTFRLFDHGRQRELHVERAIAVADVGPARFLARPNRLSDERTLLVSGRHFVLERIDLPPNSTWCLEAKRETWLLVLGGDANAGSFDVTVADAVFAQSDRVDIRAGTTGMTGLVAYTGIGPVANLLRRLTQPGAKSATRPQEIEVLPAVPQPRAASTSSRLETTQ
jgi:mannose-6-phosphate isomerase